jgi:integrase
MARTEPIRSKKHLKALAGYFLGKKQYRNHLLLVIGTHTALRISDILRLRWDDVYDEGLGMFYDHITIAEKKTDKVKVVALNPKVITALKLYYPYSCGSYLFSGNRKQKQTIGRVQAWRILRNAARAIGLGIRVSAHSLRKTFGYHCWQGGIPINVIMEIYNHSSYEVTRRYLGVTQDDTDKAYLAVSLF